MSGSNDLGLSLEKYTRIGIDTNIFIYSFSSHLEFGPKANKVFEYIHDHEQKVVTSIITYIELLSIPIGQEALDDLEEAFFSTPDLEVVDISLPVAQKAAEIRRKYSFKIADSLQLACACTGEADIFISQDDRLKKFQELPIVGLK